MKGGTFSPEGEGSSKEPVGVVTCQALGWAGHTRQGERHVGRGVKFKISAMPEEAWDARRVWDVGR